MRGNPRRVLVIIRNLKGMPVFSDFLRTSAPLASTVLPRVLQTRTPPRRAALKRLTTRDILVAGTGFEPVTFRL